ncbi:MAG: hypothetical protein IKA22_05860, partial [Lentisphaeria bacterium]|nr:hypothetical protein [Lentisphaeria bacterium]
TYKCPNCGAGLVFDAEKQKLHCDFCISDFDESELDTEAMREEAQRELNLRIKHLKLLRLLPGIIAVLLQKCR